EGKPAQIESCAYTSPTNRPRKPVARHAPDPVTHCRPRPCLPVWQPGLGRGENSAVHLQYPTAHEPDRSGQHQHDACTAHVGTFGREVPVRGGAAAPETPGQPHIPTRLAGRGD